MITVPGSQEPPRVPSAPPIDETFLMMAAATMHEQGKFSKEPLATIPSKEPLS